MPSPVSSSPGLRSWAFELVCLATFLGLIVGQLFIPPITGLSDNNDFPKVLGPAHVCKAPFDNVNTWLVTGYDAGPNCIWDSHLASTEILLVGLARNLGRPFLGRFRFDLRFSAAVHSGLLTLAFILFLRRTRDAGGWIRFAVPAVAIFIFTDVAYVAYLNSAFMDNAAWVLLLLLIAIAAGRGPAWAYGLVGVMLVCAKAQHALIGIPFAVLALFYAVSARQWRWFAAAIPLLAAACWMPLQTPPEYRAISLFNLVYSRLAPDNPALIGELGVTPDESKWIGTTAFSPGSPLNDPDWSRDFLARTSFGKIAGIYLRHPSVAVAALDHELRDSTHSIRPDYIANYRQADGFPPHSRATTFAVWSDFVSRLLYFHPYVLLILYVLPFAALPFPGYRPLLPLALTLAAAGILDFGICTLADALDTARHLFLFHIITAALLILTLIPLLLAIQHAAQEFLGNSVFRRLRVPGRLPDLPPASHRAGQ